MAFTRDENQQWILYPATNSKEKRRYEKLATLKISDSWKMTLETNRKVFPCISSTWTAVQYKFCVIWNMYNWIIELKRTNFSIIAQQLTHNDCWFCAVFLALNSVCCVYSIYKIANGYLMSHAITLPKHYLM